MPLLLIGGAAPTFNQSRGSLQEMEQVDLFLRITKWSDRIPSPELVPSYLAKAFRTMMSGRPGPVFLEIAWDVLSNGVDEPIPAGVSATVGRQLDLRRLDVDPAVELYESTAWMPVRSLHRGDVR